MDANAVSVIDIFEKKHRLEIPLFQRQYVWNQDQHWQPLWEDISRKVAEYILGKKDGPVHFLGAMVLDQKQTPTTHVDKRQVIDGQQRLTTLQIFLAALRDFCVERGAESLAAEFDSLTKNGGRMADPATEVYKVWPTQRDRDQFRDVMDAGSRTVVEKKHPLYKLPRRKRFEPRPRMVEAYLFFYSEITQFFLGSPDEPPIGVDHSLEMRLDEAHHALRAALHVVVIDLGTSDDAQVIFETLNARGAPLLPADLLRNFIFLRAARQEKVPEELYEKYWKPFDDPKWQQMVRQGRLIRARSDLFLQHYLSSRRFSDIPISHLFVEYKHWIGTEQPFATITAELEALAISRDCYAKIFTSQSDTSLGRIARFLDIFDVGTATPLLMVIVEADPAEPELRDMLAALESYVLRRTICQLSTKAYNRVFLSLASSLKKEGICPEVLVSRLRALTGESSVWPSDSDFMNAFSTRAGYRTLSHAKLVYVLKALNDRLHNAKSESVTIHSELTVEHILPQTWIEHWPLQDGSKGMSMAERFLQSNLESATNVASERRDASLQGIGNLTLLTHPLNASISNGPWSVKRVAIAQNSLLQLNRQLVLSETWDELSIILRASELANAAVSVWSNSIK